MSAEMPVPPNTPVPGSQQAPHIARAAAASSGTSDTGDVADAISKIQEKYATERDKRLRADGNAQYIDLLQTSDPRYTAFAADPWLDERSETQTLRDGDSVKWLILGAGFAGILAAVKLVMGGTDPDDIYIVDAAGGFGGTWYWNRYPGLMCDVESYCYLPLLTEMGYMPKHRYSYGPEIRAYVNAIAERYGLQRKAMFRTRVLSMDWNEEGCGWVVKMRKERSHGSPVELSVRSRFVGLGSGVLITVKLPDLPGLLDYRGHMFHTARWDYTYTGGSPEDPRLENLRNKRVGIIGTGATAVQSVPHLAKWAKELYIFQRTPAHVHVRGQAQTDADWYQTNIQDSSWLGLRKANLNGQISGTLSDNEERQVDDSWARLTSYRTVVGGKGLSGEPLAPEQIPQYVAQLHVEDLPRTERARSRVDEIVEDASVASKLKGWFPSWCKRPTFHDDYYPTFNRPNVHLVDTDGKGVDSLTASGVIANGNEYAVDLVILSTGFRPPALGWHGARANIVIRGRNGQSFDEKWDEGVSSLHGTITNGFPNLFFYGPFQGGVTANHVESVDTATSHVAYMFGEAEKRALAQGGKDVKWTIEPTREAEEAWTQQILVRAAAFAGTAGCTPSYANIEGAMDRMPMADRMKMARASPWGMGIEDYKKVIAKWRHEGKLNGLEVKVV